MINHPFRLLLVGSLLLILLANSLCHTALKQSQSGLLDIHDHSHDHSCGHMAILKENPEILSVMNKDLEYKGGAPRRVKADFSRIRILFNLYNANNDDSSLYCTREGDVIRVGSPPSEDVRCNSERSSNCYLTCQEEDVATPAKVQRVRDTIIPELKTYFEDMLLVRPLQADITLRDGVCGDFPIDPELLTSGINSDTEDLLVIVGMRPQNGVLGYAFSCGYEISFQRPVIGVLNLNPRFVNTDDVVATAKHELIHLMGFSPAAYPRYVDDNGSPRGIDNVIRTTTRTNNGQSVQAYKVITPRVSQLTKEYYDCSSADGAELEEFGGSSSAGAHWESRTFNNEIMTSSNSFSLFSSSAVLSEFTTALLEDSGWYRISDSYEQQQLLWGKGAGCNFLTQSCGNWDIDREGYFCDATNDAEGNVIERCNFDLTSIGRCYINEYDQSLDDYYQHLPNPNLGGVNFYDYCPIVARYTNGDCRSTTSTVSNQRNGRDGQFFGATSACFNSNAASGSRPDQGAKCYNTNCDNGVLSIIIGDTTIACPSDQSAARITSGLPDGYGGYVECPERGYDIICTARANGSVGASPQPAPSIPVPRTSSACISHLAIAVLSFIVIFHLTFSMI